MRASPPSERTYDRILDACEALIRRHGPAKATVLDVARSLGMSHANVYRHVPSKAALREAVVARWLGAIEAELADTAPANAPASERLAAWVRALARAKRERYLHDPELFAAYTALAREQEGAVTRHVAFMIDAIAAIIADGVRSGEFAKRDPVATAKAVKDATSTFHHPLRVAETAANRRWREQLDAILALIIAGLKR